MTANDYNEDIKWSNTEAKNTIDPYYLSHFKNFKRIENDSSSEALQRCGFDVVCTYPNGTRVTIDEKIIRKPNWRFFLETDSCTIEGYESAGWMVTGKADVLLYCYLDEENNQLLCNWLRFQPLKKWFWDNCESYPSFTMPTKNRSRGRLVPIIDVKQAVGCHQFTIQRNKKRHVFSSERGSFTAKAQ